MAVGGLAGDGQGATTGSWGRPSRDLKVHDDVLGLFGLHRGDESLHNEARVVDLEVQGDSFHESRSRSSFSAQLNYLKGEGGALQEDVFKGDVEAATRLDVEWTLSLWGNAGPTQDKSVAAPIF